jgi:hypothetical protein
LAKEVDDPVILDDAHTLLIFEKDLSEDAEKIKKIMDEKFGKVEFGVWYDENGIAHKYVIYREK